MANITRNTIVGIFQDEATAEAVASELVNAGISRSDVHIGSRSNWAADAATGGSGMTGRAPEHRSGGFMGWLESLFGSDTSEEERGHYAETVRRGNCVVAVDADESNRDRVVDILERNNARNIDEHVQNYRQSGYTGFDANAAPYSDDEVERERSSWQSGYSERRNVVDQGQSKSIPVVKEELQVGKRPVQGGGVRIYTRTVEEPVEKEVTLRDEKVSVERRPANRAATDADANAFQDQTIEVTETSEKPVITKQARVVEEVVVGKQATEHTETVRDTVRNQKVEVEQLNATDAGTAGRSSAAQDYSTDFRRHFETQYSGSGATYNTYAPAYDYGYSMANNPQYRGKRFEEVEDTLKTEYARNYPGSAWDKMRNAVRYGWERVTGQR